MSYRGQSFQELLPYFHVFSFPTCVLAELEQHSGTPGFTHLIYITPFKGLSLSLLSPSFPFALFCFLLLDSLLFLHSFSLLEIPSCQEKPKLN